MFERDISCILSYKWVKKVGKYVVKLGFHGSKAEEVWMTEKQLSQIEALFVLTPHQFSTARRQVIGIWNDKGYYAYSRLEKKSFILPEEHNLDDLKD